MSQPLIVLPDGIPPGWELNFDHDTIILKKTPPKPHWTEKLHAWPNARPSYIVHQVDFGDKIVFITDGGGRRLLGLPFSQIEALANEVSRL